MARKKKIVFGPKQCHCRIFFSSSLGPIMHYKKMNSRNASQSFSAQLNAFVLLRLFLYLITIVKVQLVVTSCNNVTTTYTVTWLVLICPATERSYEQVKTCAVSLRAPLMQCMRIFNVR